MRHFANIEDKLDWVKGLPVKTQIPEKVTQFLDTVVYPHFFKIFEDEVNKEVIEKTLECLVEACEIFGPAGIHN